MFSLTDIIVCINNTSLPPDLLSCPLVIGREYEIHGMKKCPCGQIYVDIGLSISAHKYDIVCDNCRRRFNDGIWWFSVGRFNKKETVSDQLSAIREKEQAAQELLRYHAN